MCETDDSVSILSYSSPWWLTVAHETGHVLGGQHTFGLGGILDYADGRVPVGSGPFQFHPNNAGSSIWDDPSTWQICAYLTQLAWMPGAVDTPYCMSAYVNLCGNGIVDPGEQCDDSSGCCTATCQLAANAQCSGNSMCCQQCQYAPTSTSCASGGGYCGNGQCVISTCSSGSSNALSFCGVSALGCQQQCNNGTHCSSDYATPNLAVAVGTVCETSPLSTCDAFGACQTAQRSTSQYAYVAAMGTVYVRRHPERNRFCVKDPTVNSTISLFCGESRLLPATTQSVRGATVV